MPVLQQPLQSHWRKMVHGGARLSSQLPEACRQSSQPGRTLGKQLAPLDMRAQRMHHSRVELLELMTGATNGAAT
jgi:hypothetical protein